jgi:nicastrin
LATLEQDKDGRLQGILILNSTSVQNNGGNSIYSPESAAPQGYDTPSAQLNYGYIQYKWNSRGEGLTMLDFFGIPMAYVTDSAVAQSLREESQSSSSDDNHRIVAEFNYYMGPEVMNSASCLAWHDVSNDRWNPKCLPLGGTSVWAAAGSPSVSADSPVLLVAAGMDSTGFFHDLSPGANTAASNILTLLLAAKLIGTYVTDADLDALPNRIVFALFQGESYGFVGSRSFLRDLAFPGFVCYSDLVRSKTKLGNSSEFGCLNLRIWVPSTAFYPLIKLAMR